MARALALAVATVAAVLVAGSPARAVPPVCGQEYAAFQQTSADGRWQGPGSDSRDPHDIAISAADTAHHYLALYASHRPRRPVAFDFRNDAGVLLRQFQTTPSNENGAVRPVVVPYDPGPVGTHVLVYAHIHTRCGGDDVPATVHVGGIRTVP